MNNYPLILAHAASLANEKKFATPRFILSKHGKEVQLSDRHCPHRRYPLAEPGQQIDALKCNFHGLKWDNNCDPINHFYKIGNHGQADITDCGLISINFQIPTHKWVNDIANEKNLAYSHSKRGTSSGSWLWMMEIQADLLHIREGLDSIHPELGAQTDLDSITMQDGNGWILQTCNTGWWLFIYPYTFIEWSPGCLSINYTTPRDENCEFGFDWITQFYYDPSVPDMKRKEFESLEMVFKQDVNAIEKQKGKYYPLARAMNKHEEHCVHFGKWVKKNIDFFK
jgi:hypothetical protein